VKKNRDLNFDLKQIRSFLAAVEEQNFTRASRRLGVGQATISHHIILLEKELGVSLIRRSSKEFALTPEGELFREYSAGVLAGLDAVRQQFSGGTEPGVVKIAASTIPSTYIMPALIRGVRERLPGVMFNMQVADSREVIEMVKEKRVDAGIAGRIIRNVSLRYHRIFSDEIVLIAKKGACPDSLDVAGIRKMPFVFRAKGSGTREGYEKALQRLGIKVSELQIVLECTTSESVKEAVLAGAGIAFMSRLAIARELKTGSLRMVNAPGLPVRRDFYLLHLKGRKLSAPLEALVDECAKLEQAQSHGS